MSKTEAIEELWDIWGATPAGSKTVNIPHDLVAALIAILEERKVKPRSTINDNGFRYDYCGYCDDLLPAGKDVNFCPKCGSHILWEGA